MTDNDVPKQLGAVLHVLGLDFDLLFTNEPDSGKNRERVLAWLYRILDTLDSKTSHLLGFTALLLAAQSFLAGILVRSTQTPPWISVAVLFLLLAPLLTAAFALSVFRVKWPFLGYVQKASVNTGAIDEIKDEMRHLAEVCAERAKTNKRIFFWCWVSAIAFIVTLGFAAIVVIR